MKKILLLTLFFIMTFSFFSCSKFINLGDASTGKSSENGLPEEFSDNENSTSSNDAGNTGRSDYSDDTGNSTDTGGDTGNTALETSDNDTAYDTGDFGDSAYDEETSSDEDSFSGGYPFDENFSNNDCACGEEPEYDPVCCNGQISAFNACFANCYFINSQNRICSEYVAGVCESLPDQTSDTDAFNDTDIEISDADDETIDNSDIEINDTDDVLNDDFFSDEDADIYYDIEITDSDAVNNETADSDNETDSYDDDITIDNECGCYPSDTAFYCCYVNGTVFIDKCLANCHCKGGYSSCF